MTGKNTSASPKRETQAFRLTFQQLMKKHSINEAYNLLTSHLLGATSKQTTRLDDILKQLDVQDSP